ncbi:MAG: site-2 protease family protein [Candidatus Absconditabacteria bacterium]
MLGIVLGIIMFMLLVMGHELGHFIAAKKSGVKVLEFGIGIPPKVITLWTDKSGTEYTLNLLPLGGFVRLKGEDPKNEEDFNAPDSFIKAALKHKIVILLAGVAANFVIAWTLFTLVFTLGTRPVTIVPENAVSENIESYLMPTKTFLYKKGYITENMKVSLENSPVIVAEVISGGIAGSMNIQSGDIITQINDTKINAWNLERTLKNNIGSGLDISYLRKGISTIKHGTCEITSCILGIAFSYSGVSQENIGSEIKFPFGKAVLAGLQEIKGETQLTFTSLGNLGASLFSFDRAKIDGAMSKLSGPVGAVKFGDTLLQIGGRKLFLGFAGMISLALAIFNVLPIPALDGGRLLGVLIQWIGKLKPEAYFNIEGYINLVFFVLLMGLGVFIIFKDLVRFWGVHIPFLS